MYRPWWTLEFLTELKTLNKRKRKPGLKTSLAVVRTHTEMDALAGPPLQLSTTSTCFPSVYMYTESTFYNAVWTMNMGLSVGALPTCVYRHFAVIWRRSWDLGICVQACLFWLSICGLDCVHNGGCTWTFNVALIKIVCTGLCTRWWLHWQRHPAARFLRQLEPAAICSPTGTTSSSILGKMWDEMIPHLCLSSIVLEIWDTATWFSCISALF